MSAAILHVCLKFERIITSSFFRFKTGSGGTKAKKHNTEMPAIGLIHLIKAVSFNNNSHPTGVVIPVYGIQTFSLM